MAVSPAHRRPFVPLAPQASWVNRVQRVCFYGFHLLTPCSRCLRPRLPARVMVARASYQWSDLASCNVSCMWLILYPRFRDDLAGTSVYGDYNSERSSATFSIRYDALVTPATEVLLTLGNRSVFLVTRFIDFARQGEYLVNASASSATLCMI